MSQIKKAKLLLKRGYPVDLLAMNSGLLSILRDGSRYGNIFPYTPTINVNGSANYGAQAFAHSNYPANIYESSMPAKFGLAFQMTAQTTEEADYMLACMHFWRCLTKGHFGVNDPFAGTPPPVCEFYAYGQYQFEAVPVILNSYTYDLNDQVDYVDTSFNTQVPVQLSGFVDLTVQVTPSKVREQFSLTGLANGSLLTRGFI